MTANTQR
jgi:hypothetical protein